MTPETKNINIDLENQRENQKAYFSYQELKQVIGAVKEKMYESIEEENLNRQQELIKELINKLISEKEKFKYIFTTENGSVYFVLNSGESFRIKRQEPNQYQQEYNIQPITKRIFFIDQKDWQPLLQMIKNGRLYYKRFIGEPATPEEEQAFLFRKNIYEGLKKEKITDGDFRLVDAMRERSDVLIGEPIPTTGLKPGAIPFEIGFADGGDESIYKMDGNNLILMGHKMVGKGGEEFIYPEGPGIHHYGHAVKEIIVGDPGNFK